MRAEMTGMSMKKAARGARRCSTLKLCNLATLQL
jgi:hypothetical protein